MRASQIAFAGSLCRDGNPLSLTKNDLGLYAVQNPLEEPVST